MIYPLGRIGPHSFMTSVEIQHRGEDPIEVDIEVDCVLHCDDPEWGITAEDITARIVERELTEDEIDALDLEALAGEDFIGGAGSAPKPGSFLKDASGTRWKVIDSAPSLETSSIYVMIETFHPLHYKPIRRMIQAEMIDCVKVEWEGKLVPMFTVDAAETTGEASEKEGLDSGTPGATLWGMNSRPQR